MTTGRRVPVPWIALVLAVIFIIGAVWWSAVQNAQPEKRFAVALKGFKDAFTLRQPAGLWRHLNAEMQLGKPVPAYQLVLQADVVQVTLRGGELSGVDRDDGTRATGWTVTPVAIWSNTGFPKLAVYRTRWTWEPLPVGEQRGYRTHRWVLVSDWFEGPEGRQLSELTPPATAEN